jgi:lysophospholipase L1-like esterase
MIATWILSGHASAVEVTLSLRDAPGIPEVSCESSLPKATPLRTLASPPKPLLLEEMAGWTEVSANKLTPASQKPHVPIRGSDAAIQSIVAALSGTDLEETVRISVFGASHTEADFFTGAIRRRLQESFGDAGHGFVMPAPPFGGYRAQDANLCYTRNWSGDWADKGPGHRFPGVGGLSVTSSDPDAFGWVETTQENSLGRTVSSWTVFLEGNIEGGVLLAEVDGAAHIRHSTRRASPELITLKINVPHGGHRIRLSPGGGGPVTMLGLSSESGQPGIIVDSMGVRGSSVRSWRNMNEPLFSSGLKALDPNLVMLAYGTNEVRDVTYTAEEYTADLDYALLLLQTTLPGVACILIGPSDYTQPLENGSLATFSRTEVFAQLQADAADRHGCASWDWQQATGGPGSQAAWRKHRPPWVAPDWTHFTPAGYEEVANRFLIALEEIAPAIGQ